MADLLKPPSCRPSKPCALAGEEQLRLAWAPSPLARVPGIGLYFTCALGSSRLPDLRLALVKLAGLACTITPTAAHAPCP